MEQGNFFAKLVLFVWVPVVLWLFARGPAPRAAAWSLLGAVLFLPMHVNFDLPVIPAFDKQTIATLWSLIGCMIWHRRRLRWDRAYTGIGVFMVAYLISVVVTTQLNGDMLRYGPVRLPGMTAYDAVSVLLENILNYGIPFFLARNLYRSRADLVALLRALVWLGMIYSLLALVEVRLSPQLHGWIYGFMQHDFSQTVRGGGGFRPMVFMAHGLALANFILSTSMAAIVFGRVGGRLFGVTGGWLGSWLTMVLALCKSSGALIYGAVCLPVLGWTKPRVATRLAFVLGVLVLVYPVVRMAGWLPIDALIEKAKVISEERSASLATRLLNEETLTEKARERMWFGWGGYARNRVINEYGRDMSITDSHWAICFGEHGLVGYLTLFGALVTPLFFAARRMREVRDAKTARLLSGLALITAVNVFDLLLNGLFSFIPVFLAGALVGATEGSSQPAEAPKRRRRRRRSSLGPSAAQPTATVEYVEPSQPGTADASGEA